MKDLEKLKLEYMKSLATLSYVYKQLDQFLSNYEKGNAIRLSDEVNKLKLLLPNNYKNSK